MLPSYVINNSNNKSESMAYPPSFATTNLFSKLKYCTKFHSKAIFTCAAFLTFVGILTRSDVHTTHNRALVRGREHWGGATNPGYFSVGSSMVDQNTFKFAAVTDMDQLSRVPESFQNNKPTFQSILISGQIKRDPTSQTYTLTFDADEDRSPNSITTGSSSKTKTHARTRTLLSKHNEAGRGMELSELTIYQNRLLAFDDRTGAVFEIINQNHGTTSIVVPRFVITEGDGDTDKGMKWEWASVKGDELYLGSMGKEYTKPDGTVKNTNNLWIVVINSVGNIRRIDWTKQYNFVREALGASPPGYIINEAILWSESLHKWVFLPRRVSSQMYDDNKDEHRGSNKLILVDEHFTTTEIVDIQFKKEEDSDLHGFSSFAFVPNTNDQHAMAIRTVEDGCAGDLTLCKQRSYFTVFHVLTGEVLLNEVKFAEDHKFEGLEFVDINTISPNERLN